MDQPRFEAVLIDRVRASIPKVACSTMSFVNTGRARQHGGGRVRGPLVVHRVLV